MKPVIASIIIGLLSATPADARSGHSHGAPIVVPPPPPAMGWNTWYGLGTAIGETALKPIADFLKTSGLRDAGYTLFMLDGGWWNGARDGNGNIVPTASLYPSGILALASYIAADGLTPVIYTDAGTNGCVGTGQGSYGYYSQDVATFNTWGFRGVKVDACGAMSQGLVPSQYGIQLSGVMNTIKWGYWNICNPCNWVGSSSSGGACSPNGQPNSTSPNWEFGPYLAPTYRILDDISTAAMPCSSSCVAWSNILREFDQTSLHPGSTFPGHYSDPDYLQLGRAGITDTEGQSQISLWALATAPLIIGYDPTKMTAAELTMLKNAEVIAIDQDSIASQAVLAATPGTNLQVWSKRLAAAGTRAVGLLNRDTVAHDITVASTDVGMTGTFAARDVWAGTNLGTFSSYTAAAVPSHAVVLLKLTAGTESNPTTVQINAGGGAVAPFIADTSADGTTVTTAQPISLTGVTSPAPMTVYQTMRTGASTTAGPWNSALEWFIPNLVMNSQYKVRLHFSENVKTGVGQRKFNVRINNVGVLYDFDIFAAAVPNAQYQAVVREFTVPVPQGSISVHLSVGAADFPAISGIEAIKQ